MATGRSIIVGGGIAAGTPFTTNYFPYIANSDPATLANGNMRQDTSSPPKVYIGEASLATGATVIGGATGNTFIQESVMIGSGAAWAPSGAITNPSVIIGKNAAGGTSAQGGNVIIGVGATNFTTGGDNVIIGRGAAISSAANSLVMIGAAQTIGSGSTNGVFIGQSVNHAGLSGDIVIGSTASISGGNYGIIVGQGSTISAAEGIVLGANASCGSASSMVFGHNGSAVSAQSVNFVNSTNPPTTLLFGKGNTNATPTGLTFRLTNGTGSNVAAGDLILQAGLSTGNATNGAIKLQTGPIGSSGSTLATARVGFQVQASTTAADTDILVYDVNGATLKRVSVGANDSGGVGFKLLRIAN